LGLKTLNTLHRELSLLTQRPDEKIQPYSLKMLIKIMKIHPKLEETCDYEEDWLAVVAEKKNKKK
jgi:hypothetical protein